jgi:hypothetical protein
MAASPSLRGSCRCPGNNIHDAHFGHHGRRGRPGGATLERMGRGREDGRLRFRGWIAGLGTASGHRLVIGHWTDSPLGPVTDVMSEDPSGLRVLYAPSQELAGLLTGVYSFDRVERVPVAAAPAGDGWRVEAGGLHVAFRAGGRGAAGRALRLVPAALAGAPWWIGMIDLPARVILAGVRTKGRGADGSREWYGATDQHNLVEASASLDGVDLGGLRDVDPPVRFGFGSVPPRPSLVHLTTVIEPARP